MKIKKKVEGDDKKKRDAYRVSTETMMDKLYYSHLSELLFECGTNGKSRKTNSEKKKNNNKTYINKLNKK